MADQTVTKEGGGAFPRKLKDMGDGTWAEGIFSRGGTIWGADGATAATPNNPVPVEIANSATGNVATVKAGNVAAVAADSSLVVALNPLGQLSSGRAADANSTPVALSNEDVALLTTITGANNLTSRKTADGQVKAGAGYLHTVTIAGITATPTAGLLTLYDSLTEANTVLYSEWIFATDVGHTVTLDIPFATGLYVGFDATLANVQVTVSYR